MLSPDASASDYRLVLDAPQSDRRPRNGAISVQGWALPSGAYDAVSVRVSNRAALKAKIGLARPDVRKAFPDRDTDGHSGFYCEFSSEGLISGVHSVTVQLIADGAVVGEEICSVLIDHRGSTNSAVTDDYRLVCDSPPESDIRPRSGSIAVRGWALPTDVYDRITVQISGNDQADAKIGLARPDVMNALPDLDTDGHSGFHGDVSSEGLKSGIHFVTVRMMAKGLVVRHLTRSLLIVNELPAERYKRWIATVERSADMTIGLKLGAFHFRPLISIAVHSANTDPVLAQAMLRSVIAQQYSNWELCIVGDCDSAPHIRKVLSAATLSDARIKVRYSERPAADFAGGQYVLSWTPATYFDLSR